MIWQRREVLIGVAALAGLRGEADMEQHGDGTGAYGLIGQMKAAAGKREALIALLAEGTRAMPGNLAYTISRDRGDPDAIWIVEIWVDQAAHQASLQLPAVQAAIAKGRPLIAGFGTRAEVSPVEGTY